MWFLCEIKIDGQLAESSLIGSSTEDNATEFAKTRFSSYAGAENCTYDLKVVSTGIVLLPSNPNLSTVNMIVSV